MELLSTGSPWFESRLETERPRGDFLLKLNGNAWAFRPSVADVFERLEEFFPGHNLDQPMIDPLQKNDDVDHSVLSPTTDAIQSVSHLKENRVRHRKSIRFVAAERSKALEKSQLTSQPTARTTALARRRSTEFWESKFKGISDQTQQGSPPVVESPMVTSPARLPIKWIKGKPIEESKGTNVFLALNASTAEFMAVKQVGIPHTSNEDEYVPQINMVKALKVEQQTLEILDHPNIVRYLGFEESSEAFRIFLEYVPGRTLASCIQKNGKIDEHVSKSITSQILDGLAYLHSKGISHGDLSTDNVNGICKLSNFKASKRTDDICRNDAAMTRVPGSPIRVNPDMPCNHEMGYNPEADIWNLGCIFLQIIAGQNSWEQVEPRSMMYQPGCDYVPPSIPVDATLSEQANNFRLQCFMVDRGRRTTAEALRSHPWLTPIRGWRFTGFCRVP